MTYDPFQTHSALGPYSGLMTPFQSPYTSLNPVAAFNPLAAAYPQTAGIIPHLQLAQILAARASSPWNSGLNNPLLASAVLQNPLLAATLENPLMNPIFVQTHLGAQPNPFDPHNTHASPPF